MIMKITRTLLSFMARNFYGPCCINFVIVLNTKSPIRFSNQLPFTIYRVTCHTRNPLIARLNNSMQISGKSPA